MSLAKLAFAVGSTLAVAVAASIVATRDAAPLAYAGDAGPTVIHAIPAPAPSGDALAALIARLAPEWSDAGKGPKPRGSVAKGPDGGADFMPGSGPK